MASRYSHSQ